MKLKSQKSCIFTILSLAISLMAFFTMSLNASEEDIIEREFTVSGAGTLKLTSDLGSIELEGTETNNVTVTIYREIRTSDDERIEDEKNRLKIEFDQQGDDVSVNVDYDRIKNNSFFSRKNLTRLKFKVNVPRQYSVDLSTSGGHISMANLVGDVKGRTSGGHIEVAQLEGPVEIRTSGGHIEGHEVIGQVFANTSGGHIGMKSVEGDMELKTSGGSIKVRASRGTVVARTSGGGIDLEDVEGKVDARTSGGSIRAVILGQLIDDCTLSTSGGNVVARVSPSLNAEINASTSGGHVSTDLPVTVVGKIKNTRLTGTLNDGGKLLKLKTSGGNVRLEAIN